ncbi:hypothetical protein SEA_PUPPER_210 [Gordonia phage Pupper]|uniref:Uncharacterized protein n=1 Tax=Gordonia phage Pupper TaxID=2571249 RepID=A0A4Y6EIY7_9CAUD|nr:hypothetical protein KHQ83_gp067 [Gordonia phage Pupper]QDF18696.1 hypothetical protein SEA_PUPPER_210 [Gordonia phage Pupper]
MSDDDKLVVNGIEITYSQRGFQVYGDEVETLYGEVVRVYESSSAEGPRCWLQISGGDTAHLDVEMARAIRDRLDVFLDQRAPKPEKYPMTVQWAKAIYEAMPSEDPTTTLVPWEQLSDADRRPYLQNARNLGYVFPDQYPALAEEQRQYREATTP